MARPKFPTGSKQTVTNTTTGMAAGTAPATEPKAPRPESKKLGVVKTDSRANVVPINLEDEVRLRAFDLYQQRGCVAGYETQDWLTAEREVLQRYHQQSA